MIYVQFSTLLNTYAKASHGSSKFFLMIVFSLNYERKGYTNHEKAQYQKFEVQVN